MSKNNQQKRLHSYFHTDGMDLFSLFFSHFVIDLFWCCLTIVMIILKSGERSISEAATTSTDSDDVSAVDEPTPAKKQRLHPRILDGTFYEIVSIDGDNIVAKCIECNKPRRGNLKSTGNFISHYRNAHQHLADNVEKYLNRSIVSDIRSAQASISAPPTSKADVCNSFTCFSSSVYERTMMKIFYSYFDRFLIYFS